ncbi:hypothetical protein JL722_1993 [Aureococcus anophagefferens]|nr:hypothetical protein JL722_1993 [Aureococcus anophagefferens]
MTSRVRPSETRRATDMAMDEGLLTGVGLQNPLHGGSSLNDAPPSSLADAPSKGSVVRNFLLMSLCFSLNHGTVTALISLAGSELGASLGNTSLGVLYFVYTFTAAFASHSVVALLGAKRTLVLGLAVYCCYVASYLVAYFVEAAARPAVLVGAALGGAAAGFLWPAQGAYYAKCAERYAAAADVTREQANSTLGSYFSCCYLACEVLMKLCSSLLPLAVPGESTKILYVVYTAVACGSAFFMSFVADCACMIPMNFAFGFGASYLNGYFMSAVVAPSVGEDKIGYLSSVVVGSAALLALPLGALGKALGRQAPVVALGACCFGTFAVANLSLAPAALGSWPALVPLAVVFGCGRSTWETNFKATFADYFPHAKEAAFANVQLQSGVASTIGFFVNPRITPDQLGYVALTCSLAAVGAQFAAAKLHAKAAKEPGYGALRGDATMA